MTRRAQLICVAAIFAVAAPVDFVQRIYVPRSMVTRDAILGTLALPEPPLSLASARQRLQSWLPTQAPGPQGSATNGQDELADFASQVPDRVEIGGWHFMLRGIFDAGPRFAVLDVMANAGGEIEQHRVSAGEAINGVRVERISDHGVTLSDSQKTIHLALFIDPENKENNMAPSE